MVSEEWKFRRNYLTKEGDKSTYVCNRNKLCKAEVRLFYDNANEKVSLYQNNVEHDHSGCDDSNWGIPQATKEELESLYKSGVKMPRLIQYALRQKNIDVPTTMQINNWIRYYKKKEIGKTNLTFAELEAWCIKRLNKPDDKHEPFVIGYDIHVDEDNPKLRTFHVSISTLFLLEHGLMTRHLCTDATYKLMWHGFPVFLIGVTDMKRKFHPISLSICCNEETQDYEFIFRILKEAIEKYLSVFYDPNILVADGAHAITNGFSNVFKVTNFIRIMCWVHMLRNVEKRLNGDLSHLKEAILSDIKIIQRSISTMHFKYSSGLFLSKWRSKNIQPLNEFLIYFENEWLLSSNCGWYEGICDRTPKHNNALEATNRVIKSHHTLRSRLSLSHYLSNAISMLKQWSIDRSVPEGSFSNMFEIDEYYTFAYTWMKEQGVILRVVNTFNFIVCKKNYEHLINDYQNFLYGSSETLQFDFDQLKEIVTHVFMVAINQNNWQWSTCTCSYYQKNYACSHVISVSVSLNLTKIPTHCKNIIQIGEKPKRGRIPNALKALEKQ